MPRRYLFVCAANHDRSRTAEAMLREMIAAEGIDAEVRSAGLHVVRDRTDPFGVAGAKQLTRELCEWADEIHVMSEQQKRALVEEYGQPASKVRSLSRPCRRAVCVLRRC